jgi:mRNA interferase RelE/StbE
MIYELAFHPVALAEWAKLDPSMRSQFKKKLAERLTSPRVPSMQLHGRKDRYKINPKTMKTCCQTSH